MKNAEITYYASYIPDMDRTVIFKMVVVDGKPVSETVSGWYYGEVDPELVNEYKEKQTCEY